MGFVHVCECPLRAQVELRAHTCMLTVWPGAQQCAVRYRAAALGVWDPWSKCLTMDLYRINLYISFVQSLIIAYILLFIWDVYI